MKQRRRTQDDDVCRIFRDAKKTADGIIPQGNSQHHNQLQQQFKIKGAVETPALLLVFAGFLWGQVAGLADLI